MTIKYIHVGVQMKRKDLTEPFMMILILKKPFSLHGLYI